jgi:SAM-dependent methyltransferase
MHNNMYQDQYSREFVGRWDELIGWDGRRDGENGFFERLLHARGARRVADVASGTGYHAVHLARCGFSVTATDGSANMIRQTEENARRNGVGFEQTAVVDWRDLADRFGEGEFDALVCLGNAFTHLFEDDARRQTLKAMRRVLKPGGLLLLDHRNYDKILDQGYSSKHRYYYTGDNVTAEPIEINDGVVCFEYRYPDNSKYHLHLYPLRREYVMGLLDSAGFTDIKAYGDFSPKFDPQDVDFIQQVAVKPA